MNLTLLQMNHIITLKRMVQKGTNVTQSWDLNNFRKVYDMILKTKKKKYQNCTPTLYSVAKFVPHKGYRSTVEKLLGFYVTVEQIL